MKTPKQINLGGFIFRRLRPIRWAIALAQSLAVILTALAATAQTRPVANATNVAGIITSAGFIVTSGGLIAFTNASSAKNHEKEIEDWNHEGATLTTEEARELEPKWAANPRDEPTLARLLSYRLLHY